MLNQLECEVMIIHNNHFNGITCHHLYIIVRCWDSNLETQGPEAVASQAQQGYYQGQRVSTLLSYCWLRCLTDLEFKCGNLETDQYKVIAKEAYLSLMVFLLMVSLVYEMNTAKHGTTSPPTFEIIWYAQESLGVWNGNSVIFLHN